MVTRNKNAHFIDATMFSMSTLFVFSTFRDDEFHQGERKEGGMQMEHLIFHFLEEYFDRVSLLCVDLFGIKDKC